MRISLTVVIASPTYFHQQNLKVTARDDQFVFLCMFEHHTLDYPDLVNIRTLGKAMEILKLFIKLSNSVNQTQTQNNEILMDFTD